MTRSLIPAEEILRLLHENSEKDFRHTTYQEESRRFHLLMQGDMAAVEESVRIINPAIQGKLSSDPLRNLRYLFIINTGLASRYVIEAGVPQETIYSTSDLYIQRADLSTSIKEIEDLNREFWTKAVEMVRAFRSKSTCSRHIAMCLDYIDSHFTSRIALADLAEHVGLHPNYLASLFKKEMGMSFASYLMSRKVDIAQALLTRTEYSYSQIAYTLAFCSQSHFTKVFRDRTGLTPRQYRMQYYNTNISKY